MATMAAMVPAAARNPPLLIAWIGALGFAIVVAGCDDDARLAPGGASDGGADTASDGAPPSDSPIASDCTATFVAMESYRAYSCGLTDKHEVWCWGALPGSAEIVTDQPKRLQEFGDDVVALGRGAVAMDLCVVKAGGVVSCWDLASTGPVTVEGLTEVAEVAVGEDHACARTDAGELWCWGENSAGQLGDNSTLAHATPKRVPSLTGVTAVRAGAHFTCALTSNAGGTLLCWGANNYAQVGDGTREQRLIPTANGLTGITGLAVGFEHSAAVKSDGTVWCWGYNATGACGTAGTPAESPIQVSIVTAPAVGVTVGGDLAAGHQGFTCVRAGDGTIACLGNGGTALGPTASVNGGTTAAPWKVGLPAAASDISAGGLHVCARTSAGAVHCWGAGILGTGEASSSVPMQVEAPGGAWTSLSSSCGTKADGAIWCWGFNNGSLGDGTTTPMRPRPARVLGIEHAVQAESGYHMRCWLGPSGSVWCAGNNSMYKWLDATPTLVTGFGSLVKQLSWPREAGRMCAVSTDGTATCVSFLGQFAHDTSLGSSIAQMYGACARQMDGTFSCPGFGPEYGGISNDGACGWKRADGTVRCLNSAAPNVAGIVELAVVQEGTYCGLDGRDGTVWCWGPHNRWGELGNGTTTPSATDGEQLVATRVVGLTDVDHIVDGVCAHKRDGTIWCWGYASSGRLGNGFSTPQPEPRPVRCSQ